MGPVRALLAGGRHHFQHGPIDLVIGLEGDPDAVACAVEKAWIHFQPLLPALVTELRALRRPMQQAPTVTGPVAQRMVTAAAQFPGVFLTPMAAVAGAVADELIGCFQGEGIARAYVNNGGDIALHLAPGSRYRVGIADEGAVKQWKRAALSGQVELTHASAVRGIATSGWRGRSFSLGIADSVTVLAADAASADVAATLIANAVNVESPAVQRRPACELKDDTDLGECLVTVAVGPLSPEDIGHALEGGRQAAERMQRAGLIHGAALTLQGMSHVLSSDSVQGFVQSTGESAFAA